MLTLGKLKIIYNVIECIKRNQSLFNVVENIYLFGSLLKKNQIPNDVDILLIYSKYSDELIVSIDKIRSVLESKCNLPIDLTILSIEEEKNIGFLDKINPNLKLK